VSEENVEIVRRGIVAFNRQDLEASLALRSTDAELDWSRSNGPLKGVYRGHREFMAFWDVFWSTFEDVQLENHGFTEAGSEVVYSNTAHIRGRDGIEVVAKSALVFTIEDGLQIRLEMFQVQAQALEAAGLSE
jgi:ketosteroid isomerase-like protein